MIVIRKTTHRLYEILTFCFKRKASTLNIIAGVHNHN